MAEFILQIGLAVVAIFIYEVACWLLFDDDRPQQQDTATDAVMDREDSRITGPPPRRKTPRGGMEIESCQSGIEKHDQSPK